MKVVLIQDQHYISANGSNCFGKKGETINVESEFLKFIEGKYKEVSTSKQEKSEPGDEKPEKKLKNMNKDELIAEAKRLEASKEEISAADTNKKLISLIEAKNS